MIQHKWRLSSTIAGLAKGWYRFLGLPAPSCTFADFAARVPQGEGGEAVHGYKSAVLTWQDLSRAQVTILQDIVDAAFTAGAIHATVIRNSGYERMVWVDISGKPTRLNVQPFAGTANTAGVQSAELVINNVTIVNNPSSYA